MTCNPFLTDAPLTPYIRAIRCRVSVNYTDPVSISATVSELGCVVDFLGRKYTARYVDSGLYIIDTPELYMVISAPVPGTIIEQDTIPVNPAKIDRVTDADTPSINTVIHVKTPIKCYLYSDRLTIDLEDSDVAVAIDEKETGIRSINGLLPDDFGNIVIRSASPRIAITVDRG